MTGKVIKVGQSTYFEVIENGTKSVYPIQSSRVAILEDKFYNFIFVDEYSHSDLFGNVNWGDGVKSVMLISFADDNGIKETTDKLTYDIDFDFIKRMAGRMQRNRGKYPVGNWKKKIDVEELKQALFRHTMEIMQGNYDDEQYYGHLIAVACNAFMITYQLKNADSVTVNQ